jgi:hypothetical protein
MVRSTLAGSGFPHTIAVRESSEVGEVLMGRILSDIEIFRGEAEQSDDISLITAVRLIN